MRGHRIELGEIETVLGRHPSVREAVVVAREDEAGDKRLVAYVVWRGEADWVSVREALREKLPESMVPPACVSLEQLPLTASGKVDRAALPGPEEADAGAGPVAPRTAVEEILAGIFAEVLGLETVGIHDDFFELGGHSLLATQVVSRVREALGVELALRQLFETPTVAELARAAENAHGGGGPSVPPVARVDRGGILPLSFAQQRLWFLDQLEGRSAAYNIPAAFRLRGPLDGEALGRAFEEMKRRHETLRTRFERAGGQPRQVIEPTAGWTLTAEDLSGLAEGEREQAAQRRATQTARQPFDLGRGPLLRAVLLRLADRDHVLVLAMHHIVSDAWSVERLVRELATLYEAFSRGRPSPLPELRVQYADFAVWQRRWLEGDALESQLAYWRERLAGLPPLLDLPADHARPEVKRHRGGRRVVELPQELAEKLGRLSHRRGATRFMVLLAAFQALLARVSGRTDVAVGSPIANRTRKELEGLIGFFVNTLVLRTDLSRDPTFAELVSRVRQVALGAYAHQDVPFERLVEELNPERVLSHHPLFQVAFAVQSAVHEALELPGLEVARQELEEADAAKFDLTLTAVQDRRGLRLSLGYDRDLFEPATVDRMLEQYRRILETVVDNPGARLSELPVGEAEAREAGEAGERGMSDERKPASGSDLSTEDRVLLAYLLEQEGVAPPTPAIRPRPDPTLRPLSFAQERMWFLHTLEPDSPLYNLPAAVRLVGPLDEAALQRALAAIVERHEVLRTRFETVQGQPAALVSDRAFEVARADLSALGREEREAELARRVAAESLKPFDLARGPLVRASLLRLGEREHVLQLTMQHVVSDAWSTGVLIRELAALYDAFAGGKPSPLPPLPIQYADFAHWQREWLQGEVLETQIAYWKQQLAHPPSILELPTDRPRPAVQTSRGAVVRATFAPERLEGVQRLAKREGATPFMVLLAAFEVLLRRYSGQTDLLVGCPIAGRTRQEVEGLIGFFVNTLVLRVDISGDPTFRELLGRVKKVALEAYAHQDVPFEKLFGVLKPERALSHSPLFQVAFNLQNALQDTLQLQGLTLAPLETATDTAKFDLSLYLSEKPQGLRAMLEYSTDLFDGGDG